MSSNPERRLFILWHRIGDSPWEPVVASEHKDETTLAWTDLLPQFGEMRLCRYGSEGYEVHEEAGKVSIVIHEPERFTPDMGRLINEAICETTKRRFHEWVEQQKLIGAPIPIGDGRRQGPELPTVDPSTTWSTDELNLPVTDLSLSYRCVRLLLARDIRWVGQLVELSRPRLVRIVGGRGRRPMREIEAKLDELGLRLGMVAELADADPHAPEEKEAK